LKSAAISFLFAAILLCAATLAQPAKPSEKSLSPLEETLLANSTSVLEAQKAKNPTALTRLLAHDFLQVGSDGHTYGSEEIVGDAKEGRLHEYQVYDARVVSIDDNSAIVTYNSVIHMPEGDTGLAPRYQHISDLWVKQGEAWKLKFQQSTPLRSVD
jgi:hypothetical protein